MLMNFVYSHTTPFISNLWLVKIFFSVSPTIFVYLKFEVNCTLFSFLSHSSLVCKFSEGWNYVFKSSITVLWPPHLLIPNL
jgi:hypothetical protein